MTTAWFIVPYKTIDGYAPNSRRYPAVVDFDSQIKADGGSRQWTEVLGNRAIVKVSASDATLTAIGAAAGITRVPLSRLNDPLSSLTAGQRTAIKNQLLDAGYTANEVNARFPNLANNTLGDALRFLASRRLRPRYDPQTQSIVLDGQVDPVRSVDDVDAKVP